MPYYQIICKSETTYFSSFEQYLKITGKTEIDLIDDRVIGRSMTDFRRLSNFVTNAFHQCHGLLPVFSSFPRVIQCIPWILHMVHSVLSFVLGRSWWRHQMETFSVQLALYDVYLPYSSGFLYWHWENRMTYFRRYNSHKHERSTNRVHSSSDVVYLKAVYGASLWLIHTWLTTSNSGKSCYLTHCLEKYLVFISRIPKD